MKFKKITRILLISLAPLMLVGCGMHPKPITQAERTQRILRDWHNMFVGQEPTTRTLTIYQAMARAVKYNLDLRLKAAESVFARKDLKVSQADVLPNLVASAGYIARSNQNEVLSPLTGLVSTAEDRFRRVGDLNYSWNVLDFGVSYIEAKQKSDQYLIAQERRRKMLQRVIRDTRYAFWRALAAQQLLGQIHPFIGQIKVAINQSKKIQAEKLQSPLEAARYRRELWHTYREMNKLRYELSQAKPELIALVNIRPGSNFTLIRPGYRNSTLPKRFPTNVKKLELRALHDRPEIREEDYRTRISLSEIHKARVRMFPGLEINYGTFYDSNSFLVNNAWNLLGIQLSWNILKLFTNYHGIKLAKQQKKVADIRRMALSMAIITQVDLAKLRYHQAKLDLNISKHILDNDRIIYNKTQAQKIANVGHQLAVIQARAKYILSELRYYVAYAEWENSAGQLLDSVGFDPLHAVTTTNISVNELAHQIRYSLSTTPPLYAAMKKQSHQNRNNKSRQYRRYAKNTKVTQLAKHKKAQKAQLEHVATANHSKSKIATHASNKHLTKHTQHKKAA